jgi:hypothetical protein
LPDEAPPLGLLLPKPGGGPVLATPPPRPGGGIDMDREPVKGVWKAEAEAGTEDELGLEKWNEG